MRSADAIQLQNGKDTYHIIKVDEFDIFGILGYTAMNGIPFDTIVDIARALGLSGNYSDYPSNVQIEFCEPDEWKVHRIEAKVSGGALDMNITFEDGSNPSSYTVSGNFIVHWSDAEQE